jgi:hypothetical protein
MSFERWNYNLLMVRKEIISAGGCDNLVERDLGIKGRRDFDQFATQDLLKKAPLLSAIEAVKDSSRGRHCTDTDAIV